VTSPWTEADIADQSGRVVLITGANSGIGFEAARALTMKGAHVVMACRNPAKASDAKAEIDRLNPSGETSILECDLDDLELVATAAQEFRDGHDSLDLLINNAGLMATPQGTTAQGFETQFGVNHLAHFALTGHLLDLLMVTGGSRVVNVSSQAHRFGKIDFDDLQSVERYSAWGAYGQSKLANLLFTFELQRRLDAAGADTIATAAHPGASNTNLGHEPAGPLGKMMELGRPIMDRFFTQTAAMGALPTLRAATDLSAAGGDYFGPSGLGEQKGHPVKVDSNGRSKDEAVASRLWDVSVALTGIDYAALAS